MYPTSYTDAELERLTPGQRMRWDELQSGDPTEGHRMHEILLLQVVLGDLEIVTEAGFRLTPQGKRRAERILRGLPSDE